MSMTNKRNGLNSTEVKMKASMFNYEDKASRSSNGQKQSKSIFDSPKLNSKKDAKKKGNSNQAKTDVQPAEIGPIKKVSLDCLLYVVKATIAVFDLLSHPIYYFMQQVCKKRHATNFEKSCKMNPNDINSPWSRTNVASYPAAEKIDTFQLYDQMMVASFKKYAKQPCYGFRKVLEEKWTKRPDSDKLLKQVALSDYHWVTFEQFEEQIEAARRGFLLQGIRAGDKVMLYADTRPEWQISSQAIIRIGGIVVTMYSMLGVEGIIHCMNEVEATHVLAQKDKVEKLLELKAKLPRLKRIIYFASSIEVYLSKSTTDTEQKRKQKGTTKRDWPRDFQHPQVDCMSFEEVVSLGAESKDKPELVKLEEDCSRMRLKRDKNSIIVIMYTSGSTGIPKGVLMSNGNIIASAKSLSYVIREIIENPHENIFAAYLPLAHVFEFCIQSMVLYHGVRFGFATAHTLTDKSVGLLPGQQGDLTLLKPTVMIIVPSILDKIFQGIKQALEAQSYFKKNLLSYLISYKTYWQKKHYETPLVNKLVCSKFATVLGGRIKCAISGSAPLSPDTHTYLRAALNIKLPQGYGTTETCGASTCQLFDDQAVGNVGLPVPGDYIKLEDWLEGNYQPSDKPNPRGEIVIGGDLIAHGYLNLEEQTKEAFYVDKKGIRWYRTGDIGEFLPNGNLKIIDRKKDLVKLQNGEYISLGRVESSLKSNLFTDNFCVYANSNYNFIVALGSANAVAIRGLAQQLVDSYLQRLSPIPAKHDDSENLLTGEDCDESISIQELKEILSSYQHDNLKSRKTSSAGTGEINERLDKLCKNSLIQKHVFEHIKSIAKERNLMTLEVPRRFLLLAEEWTEDKNLITAALKIRRNYIYKRYEKELKQLYSST